MTLTEKKTVKKQIHEILEGVDYNTSNPFKMYIDNKLHHIEAELHHMGKHLCTVVLTKTTKDIPFLADGMTTEQMVASTEFFNQV